MEVDQVAWDVVPGTEGVAPERQERLVPGIGVERAVSRELDGGGDRDEGRFGGLLVPVVGVPEVQGELGERQDAEAGVEGRWVEGDAAMGDGLAGLIVEHAVEGGRGDGAVGTGVGGSGEGRGAEGE